MSKSKCSYHRKSCRFHRWQICIVKEWERPYRVQYWKATCRFRSVGSEMANKFSALEMKSYDISTATQRVLSSRKSHPIIREIIHASQVTMLELNDSLCHSQSTSHQNGSLNQKIRVHATWTTRRSTVKLTGKERVKKELLLWVFIELSWQFVYSFPIPTITWKRAVGNLPGDYKDFLYESTISLSPNGSLTFREITKASQSYYLCEAKNGIGSGVSKVVFLKVNVPAHFKTKTKQILIAKNKQVFLNCNAAGDTPITISWRLQSSQEVIRESADIRFSIREQKLDDGMVSELGISNTYRHDSGVYICSASNAYGHDEVAIDLIVQETPEPPKNLRINSQVNCNFSLFDFYLLSLSSSEFFHLWNSNRGAFNCPGKHHSPAIVRLKVSPFSTNRSARAGQSHKRCR